MSQKSILVTGACGLIGRAVARRLVGEGKRVIGLDLNPAVVLDAPSEFVTLDLNDAEGLWTVFDRYDVGRVVHCGGVSGRAVSRSDPYGTLRTNVMGTANVFEAARKFGVARVVLCSSGSVYGCTARDPVTEDIPLFPVNAYGASKIASEAILHAYAREWGVDGVALRIFQAFGPRRTTRCHLKMMIEAALAGCPADISHSGTSRRQYIYVDDVIDALVLALYAPRLPRRSYNISGGTSLTLQEVAEIVCQVLPGLEVRFGDDPLGAEYCLEEIDLTSAARDLGFAPRHSLSQGIAAYAAWLQAAGS